MTSYYPSWFTREYLCQVPQRKPLGALVLSIVVGDLVFLQVLWALYKMLVDWLCLSKRPEVMVCDGCRRLLLGDIPLRDRD